MAVGTNHFEAAEWLRATNNRGYGPLPIPQPRDAEIEALLRSWMALDESTRQAAAQGIAEEQRFTLLAYSERMASLAVRKRNQELIRLGLLALGIDGWRGDWRVISQCAVDAIRATGDAKLILVPGDAWSSAEKWPTANGLDCASMRHRADLGFPALGNSISKLSPGAASSTCVERTPVVG